MLEISNEKIDKQNQLGRLYSLKTLVTPSYGRIAARWLMLLSAVFIVILFLPWQQNIRGRGVVTALDPAHRPQTIETAIPGRINRWHIREGQYVAKGDTILSLSEIKDSYFDPRLLLRLEQQISAKEGSLKSKQLKAGSLKQQVEALRTEMKIKLVQAQAKLEAEKVKFQNAENQLQRNKNLFDAGNIPLTKFQELEYKFKSSQAEYNNAQIEMGRIEAEYLDKINKVESDINNTLGEVYDTEGTLAKLKTEFANMSIRSEQYQVIAPQEGIIVKALKAGIGETIKEGEPVCTIMPSTSDLAVAMFVKAMDVPLISKGRKVRIQFDGWPSLQFSGWPNVSVGTFGGTVEVIDFVNSQPGEFRILIVPDKEDEAWPQQLRMGSGTRGWVMLNSVPVWFEIWRQLNGFPATLYEEPENPLLDAKEKRQEEGNK